MQSVFNAQSLLVTLPPPTVSGWHPNELPVARATDLGARLGAGLVLHHAAYDTSLRYRSIARRGRIDDQRLALLARRRACQLNLKNQIADQLDLAVAVDTRWDRDPCRSVLDSAVPPTIGLILKQRDTHGQRSQTINSIDARLLRTAPMPLWLVGTDRGRGPQRSVIATLDAADEPSSGRTVPEEPVQTAKAIARTFGAPVFLVDALNSDATMRAWRNKLANRYELPPEQIIIGQGSRERAACEVAQRLGGGLIVMRPPLRHAWSSRPNRPVESLLLPANCDLLFTHRR